MKIVIYKDNDGRLHRSLIRDTDPESTAPEGLPLDPPMIDDILEEAKICLHNELVVRNICDLSTLRKDMSALSSAVKKCITKNIVNRYHESDNKK